VKKQVVVLACLTFVLVLLAPFPGDIGFSLIALLNHDDLQVSESVSTGYHTGSIPVSWTGHISRPETGSTVLLAAMEALPGYATEEKHYGFFITSPRSDRQLSGDSALQHSSQVNRGTSGLIQNDNTITMSCREPIDPVRLSQNNQTYSPRLLPSAGSYPPVGEHSKKPIVMNNHDMHGPEINNYPDSPGLTPSPSAFDSSSSLRFYHSSDMSSDPSIISSNRSSVNESGDSLRQHH